MADTIADVLVRFGVDTAGLRTGFRDARSETSRFAADIAKAFAGQSGIGSIIGIFTGDSSGSGASTFLRGGGSFFGAIGRAIAGLFRRTAQDIATQIRASFDLVTAAYRTGSLGLGATIQQLESERASAIQRLSGKKGGRKELDQLLPQFDKAIADLKARQQAVFDQFDNSLELLRTGEAFRNVAADVREIVAQYRAYVDAGGDLARANEFLSRSLEQIRAQSATALAEGETQAIEDALQLNDLLRERQDLLAASAEEERSILSRGVLERQRTVAQDKSAELEAVRQRRDERLADLDQNIALLQLKLDSEARVFALASDRVALETRLLELKAAEFDREAAQLAALRDVVAGITPGATGLFSLTPALRTELNLGGVQIFVGDTVTSTQARAAGEEVIEGMMRALVRERARFGLNT